ncbi:phage terminase large subunit family protein [Roseovarius ramblicola]|uniref:Phage terminase large subunit family protein n=1 Tax=Roseovarius ramblicola TaxID=2022336 RepID=A0ABV5HYN2_9RHOB
MPVEVLSFDNASGLVRAARRARRFLRPPPNLRPSEWSERTIRIPIGNAVPGLIRFDNAPYQREVLDMTADPRCVRITLMWGAQTGKTQTALCAQAYRIAHNPVSQVMMQPSQGDLHTWLETKFNPLVETNERLQELLAKPRGRDGVNNQRMKSYPGGFLMFSWSGSPKTMRGRSAPFVVCDETDGYDRTHEGHPVSLLWQRAATFGDQRMLLEISTPSIKGASWIEASFLEGDQRYFHVGCPHCGERQPLKWAQVTWSKSDAGEHLPETAGYTCRECGVVWSDGERVAAIRRGAWVASKPFRGHASYHLSELYSTFRRLQDIVQSFLDKKAAGDLQTFVNVSLAETWEEQGDQVDASSLMQRVETFPAQVPRGGAVVTAGIDMQIDRLEVEVVAWGLGEESWSVGYHVIWGDPMGQDVWRDLDDLLADTVVHESGAQLRISAACLDTGGTAGMTQAAYEYVRARRGHRLFAIKGQGGWGRPIVTSPSRKRSGRRARPVDLFTVGVDEAKVVVQRRLQIATPGPGHCHFPADRDPEWFAGLGAETLRTKIIRGFPVREWHQTRPRNEPFDCRVYAYAALKILNPNIRRALDRLDADAVEPGPEAEASAPAAGKPPMDRADAPKDDAARQKPRRRKKRSRGGGWVNNW